jgi:hypothetical protein
MGKVGYVLAFVGVCAGAYAFTLNPMQAMISTMGGLVGSALHESRGFMSGPDVVTKQQMIWTASLVFISLGVILVIADQFLSYLQKRFPVSQPQVEEEEFER